MGKHTSFWFGPLLYSFYFMWITEGLLYIVHSYAQHTTTTPTQRLHCIGIRSKKIFFRECFLMFIQEPQIQESKKYEPVLVAPRVSHLHWYLNRPGHLTIFLPIASNIWVLQNRLVPFVYEVQETERIQSTQITWNPGWKMFVIVQYLPPASCGGNSPVGTGR